MLKVCDTLVLSIATALMLAPVAGQAQNNTSQVQASTSSEWTPEGTGFVEISYRSFDIDGEFDDTIILTGEGEVINVPELQSTGGIGVALGILTAGASSMSLFHFRASVPTRSAVEVGDAHFKVYGLEMSVVARPGGTWIIAPMFSGAASLPSLRIDNSATDGVSVQDAKYSGYAYSGGVGVRLFVGRVGQITLEYRLRRLFFNKVEATQDKITIDGDLRANTRFLKIGAILHLGGGN